MKSLKSSLQFAHAAEIAAFYAYDGHWRSVSNPDQQDQIRKIQKEEAEHVRTIKAMLIQLKSEPNKKYDRIGIFVGKCIWHACFIFGWKSAMVIAGLMEKIGTRSYRDIAELADKEGQPEMSAKLLEMAKNEEEHEKYFNEVRKNGNHN